MDHYPAMENDENYVTEDMFRPISTWGHVGYNILLEIPLVGFIFAIIFSLNDAYIARRNFARSKLIKRLLRLIISVPLIILTAIIIEISTVDTVSNAQFARFAQEFGEYSDSFMIDSANVKSSSGIKGQIINDAQMYYMAAHGMTYIAENDDIRNYRLPTGYEITFDDNPNFDEDIIKQLLDYSSYYGSSDSNSDSIVAYIINDAKTSYGGSSYANNQDGSAGKEFYGDSNGKEYHFVTSNGYVFTLPGYPVKQSDGTIEYHIDTRYGHYYVVGGSSKKSMGAENVNGDVINATRPIQASDLTKIKGIEASSGKEVHTFLIDEPDTNKISK